MIMIRYSTQQIDNKLGIILWMIKNILKFNQYD